MYVCMYVCMFVCMGETLVDLDNFWTISKISIFQNMFSRIWKKIKKIYKTKLRKLGLRMHEH